MRQAVFFRLRLRLSLQNTAALPTLILSLNLVQRLGGSHSIHDAVLVPQNRKREARTLLGKILEEQGMRAADDEGLL